MNMYLIILIILCLISTFIIAYFEFGKKYIRYQKYNGPIHLPIKKSFKVKENQIIGPNTPSSNSNNNECVNQNDDCFFVLQDNSKVYLLKTKTKNVVDQLGGDFIRIKNDAFLNDEPLFYDKELSILYNKDDGINSILYNKYQYRWTILMVFITIILIIISLFV